MFKYLLFFSAFIYVTLLIAGQDSGQKRMGLLGAYDIALAPAEALAKAPSDSLRILPAPERSLVQPASLTTEPAPAFNDFNNPTVTLRTITADAANVRDAAARDHRQVLQPARLGDERHAAGLDVAQHGEGALRA